MSSININFSVTHDEMDAFAKALKDMQAKDVLVGFPEGEASREDAQGNPTPVTNATLAYVHNNGSPERNIPARPFMVPGIESKVDPISDAMERVGISALDGDALKVDQGLHAVGTIARDAIKEKIIEGPFEPLAESTLKARARRGGEIGKAAERELKGIPNPGGGDNVRPLNETGQLRNAVQYVIRERE